MTGERGTGHFQLLMVQIDGLSRPVLEEAIDAGMMPRVAALAECGKGVVPMYSGLPSTTPAVQAALFYGVRCAVPAFAYVASGRARQMIDPKAASTVQLQLEEQAAHNDQPALLHEGSGYCNIYTAGARVSHFCPAGLGRPKEAFSRGIAYQLRSTAAYSGVILRSLLMLGAETGRKCVGAGRHSEVGFKGSIGDIWNRILACVGLRDITRLAALHDLKHRMGVVHINFIGYDKQAHRFGPRSRTSKRTLKGIDRAIGTLLDTMGNDGRVCIYSDHGQERTIPVEEIAGRRIERIVREAVEEASRTGEFDGCQQRESGRLKNVTVSHRLGEQVVGIGATQDHDELGRSVMTVESGPIAHVYLDIDTPPNVLESLAQRIAAQAPGVAALYIDESQTISAAFAADTQDDHKPSVERLEQLCSRTLINHPFRGRIAEDMEAICRHKDAGQLVLISTGFCRRPMTFAGEQGSHGGPGAEETQAFAMCTPNMTLSSSQEDGIIDILDLRRMLLQARTGCVTK